MKHFISAPYLEGEFRIGESIPIGQYLGAFFGSVIIDLFSALVSAMYLYACLRDLRGYPCTLGECLRRVAKKSPSILAAYFLYLILVLMGVLFFIIPGMILWLMFVFYICYIVDQGQGPVESFKSSKRITDGRKMELFMVSVLFIFLIAFPFVFIINSLFSLSDNILASYFVMAFVTTILTLMKQRLMAVIYIDLEYKQVDDTEDISSP